jgi:hypothetical protein
MIDPIRTSTLILGLGLIVALGACAGGSDTSEDDSAGAALAEVQEPQDTQENQEAAPLLRACEVGGGGLAKEATSVNWAGDHALVMLASDGSRVDGTLTLAPQASEFQDLVGPGGEIAPNTRIPMIGWLDLDPGAVGAVVPGDPMSTDPQAPGIAVLESRMADQMPNIILRLGAEANRRGQVRFDGAFTVLHVSEAEDLSFRGRWNSGVGTNRTEGIFCAFAR